MKEDKNLPWELVNKLSEPTQLYAHFRRYKPWTMESAYNDAKRTWPDSTFNWSTLELVEQKDGVCTCDESGSWTSYGYKVQGGSL